MRWIGRRGSVNVEDRRGQLPRIGGRGAGLGCGGLIVVVALSWLMGVDPREILGLLGNMEHAQVPSEAPAEPSAPPTDELGHFAAVVLEDTENQWDALFTSAGLRYEHPTLVLFTQATESACGLSSSAVGPFYCPMDRKVYLDLSFFRELEVRFGAGGDFAKAYVIAHEVGHHVQNLMGTSGQVRSAQQQSSSEAEANRLSVALELQADCFAGVWGHHANQSRDFIDPGDFEEGLRAAAAIGDDRLQKLGQGEVQPESFTHGTSEQRVQWLRRGLESGDPATCDTFGGS